MKALFTCVALLLTLTSGPALSLSMGTAEIEASRKMACVLAEQSLGWLTEDEYGARTHTVLDGFNENERDHIIAQALGYYSGLTFTTNEETSQLATLKLENYIASSNCTGGFEKVTHQL